MPDQVERAGLSVAREGDPRSESHAVAIGNRGKLGTRLPLAPITDIAEHRLALLIRQWALQHSLELLVPRLDLIETAPRDQVRPRRDRQLESRLEMLLIAFTAKGDAHDRGAD